MIYIYNAVSEETARYAKDYPWGYKLRTEQRYWIDSKPKHGQRLCVQTKNPKTGKWCAVKKSTYSDITLLTQDETNDHYGRHSVSPYTQEQDLKDFIEAHKEGFSDFQKHQAKILLAMKEVSKRVKYTVSVSQHGPVSLTSQAPEDIAKRQAISDEQEERKERDEIQAKRINQAVVQEYHNTSL